MKKISIKLTFYFLFALGLLLTSSKNNLIQAEKANLKATVSVFQESSISPTGRCYGPFFAATKPLLVDVYDISYNGIPIKTPQDVVVATGSTGNGPTAWIKLVRRYNYSCTTPFSSISNGHLPICSIDISQYDDLTPEQTEFREVRVKINDIDFWSSTIFDVKVPVYIKQYVDESKCYEEPVGGFDLCYQIPGQNEEAFDRCAECFEKDGVWTAIGCIPQSRDGIASTFIQIGLVIGGAIVLIMILVGAFMLSTSQGDPKKTQEAKEIITSAIIGLIFIIFSITILQFIGASVLRIPEFGQ